MKRVLLIVSIVVFWSTAAQAQAPGGVPPLGAPSGGTSGGAEGMMSFANFGEGYFLNLAVGTSFSIGKVSLGVQAPLKIRVIDKDPENDTWYREEDWDDVSDWTRIIRFIQYGNPRDPFYIRLGELVSATLGHGTIVNRYYNTLNIDHYHTGMWTAVNLEFGGAELLTNDVLAWNMTATRGYIKPFGLFMAEPNIWLKKLAVGASFAGDFTAPTWKGNPGQGMTPAELPTTDVAWLAGFDVEYQLVRNEGVAVTPYSDLNFFASPGTGWHLGVLNEFQVAKSQLQVRLEYRLLSAHYAPTYFNTLYDIERSTFLALPQYKTAAINPASPKYYYFKEAEGLGMRHGFYGELFADILGLVGIGGIFEDYQGPDNASVTLRADLPAIMDLKLSAYYTRRNFDGLSGIFSLDDAYLVAEGRYQILGPLFAFALYTRYWDEVTDADGFKKYESEDSWQFGAGAAFTF